MIHLTPIGPWSEKMETSEIRTAATSRNAKLLAVGDKSHTIKLLRRDLAHRTDALHSVAKRRTFRVELIVQFLCSFPSTQRGASFKEYRGHATAIAGLSFAYQDTHLVSIGGVTRAHALSQCPTLARAVLGSLCFPALARNMADRCFRGGRPACAFPCTRASLDGELGLDRFGCSDAAMESGQQVTGCAKRPLAKRLLKPKGAAEGSAMFQ